MYKARSFSGSRPSTRRTFRPSHCQTWRILASNKARPCRTRELKASRKGNSRYGCSPDILRVVSTSFLSKVLQGKENVHPIFRIFLRNGIGSSRKRNVFVVEIVTANTPVISARTRPLAVNTADSRLFCQVAAKILSTDVVA